MPLRTAPTLFSFGPRARALPGYADPSERARAVRTLARRPTTLAPHMGGVDGNIVGARFLEEQPDGEVIEYEVVAVNKRLVHGRFKKTAWVCSVRELPA